MNRIKVVLLLLSQAIPSKSTLGTWKIPALAKVPGFAPGSNFWRYPKTASRGHSWPWVWCKSHQSRSVGPFTGHSIRIHCWNLENTSMSKKCRVLGQGATFGVVPKLQVEVSRDLGFSRNRIKVGLLVLSQAISPESTDRTWKIPALAKVPCFAPGSNFWLCPKTASLGLSWPWVWYESHQSRSVAAFAGHSIQIHSWNLENPSISKSAGFCAREQLLALSQNCKSRALLTLGLVQIASKSVCWSFHRPFHPNPLLEPGKYQHEQKRPSFGPGSNFWRCPQTASRGLSWPWV